MKLFIFLHFGSNVLLVYEVIDVFGTADYQMLKNAQLFLSKHKYSNSALDASFKSIKYNDAANSLDPKFF